MPKIQCPQCKAVNQDVAAGDPCWQCGAALGAPAVAVADQNTDANTTSSGDSQSANGPVQIQKVRPGRTDKVPLAERPPRVMGPDYRAIIIALMVIALLIAAAIYFATHH
jgi:hypothetical protein